MGTESALMREQGLTDDMASTAFWLNCGTGVIVTLLVIAVAWPAPLFFHPTQVTTIIRFLPVSFLFGAMGVVPTAVLSRAMNFRKLAAAQSMGALYGIASTVAIALAGGKVSALVAASLVMSFITTVVTWFLSPASCESRIAF